jgi:hypothetical protein
MNRPFLLLIFVLCYIWAGQSRADWVSLGAAAKCDHARNFFALVATAETSDQKYNFNPPMGYRAFPEQANQLYTCDLGKTHITLKISVYGPQERGMGQGAGVVIISSLLVNGSELLKGATNFNWQVADERVLTRVVLAERHGDLVQEFCYSSGFDWWKPYQDMRCEPREHDR